MFFLWKRKNHFFSDIIGWLIFVQLSSVDIGSMATGGAILRVFAPLVITSGVNELHRVHLKL